ncbi:MAG: hypothetical protein AAGE85_08340 [Pseudomonadota bacterium]
MDCIDEILSGIAADDSEAVLAASELIRARMRGLDGTAVIEPYASMYAENPLDDSQVDKLKQALLQYLTGGKVKNATGAVLGLSELRDKSLIPKFREELNNTLWPFLEQGYAIGQLLLALRDAGEDVNRRMSYSSDAFEENSRDAYDYLISQGFEDPR